jgi:hypothetical protein
MSSRVKTMRNEETTPFPYTINNTCMVAFTLSNYWKPKQVKISFEISKE